MLTTLDENSVVHLIKSCRFQQTCLNWVIAWFSLYYRLWGCIVQAQSPPLPSPTTRGSNISHKHEWRADFTSSQKKSAKNVKEEKASFLYLLPLARPLFPSARTSDAICEFSAEWTDIIMHFHRDNGSSFRDRNRGSFGGQTQWCYRLVREIYSRERGSFLSFISNLIIKPHWIKLGRF